MHTVRRIGRYLDKIFRDIHNGVIAGFDWLWYGG